MRNGPTKDEVVSGRVTTRHKTLMKEQGLTVSDLCEFYFNSFGTNKKRLQIDLFCLEKKLADAQNEVAYLERQKEQIVKQLDKETVDSITKNVKVTQWSDDSSNVRGRRRMRPLRDNEKKALKERFEKL